MTARLVVLGSEDFAPSDPLISASELVEVCVQKTYLALRPNTVPPLLLKTMGRAGPETVAATWWVGHGLQVEPTLRHPNKYVRMNSLFAEFPDAILLFGNSKFISECVVRADRLQLEYLLVTG